MPNRPTPQQRQFARQLRANQTDCELILWQRLRARQLANLKFRRQFPCPPYVLDFYCPERRLAIELDGGQHYEAAAYHHDQRRTHFLRQQGIEVLRFSNLQVLEQLNDVLEHILRQVQSAATPTPPPPAA
ncbi:Very-short-patch-repair endonuclease [Pseudomonas sp. ok272]|uniref:endonuclease domain-containing protein n=1 Tax=unclassified Pseudomonas TaxID=196821 RepID=UPI0008D51556|nr:MULTISPECIES: endonuclease domain-containing protein [unclassified Pseudomonas]SEN49404.1 Very-short-patch-repair endonuclease [Pseudomonas sp. ok272]SFN30390.1 Very-short-patch-repair endonuclease [Pseudomonas sp. ok602]